MFVNANQYKTAKSDAAMIQSAIDEAARLGKSVVVPMHNERTGKDVWEIENALVLQAGTIIILQNCHLRLADGAVCNMFTNSLAQSETMIPAAEWERGIHIRGIGNAILDGGNHNQMYENNGIARKVMKPSNHHITENCMMRFRYVTKMVIENITVRNQRYWGIWFRAASFCRVSGIHFETDGNIPNQYGVDLSGTVEETVASGLKTGKITRIDDMRVYFESGAVYFLDPVKGCVAYERIQDGRGTQFIAIDLSDVEIGDTIAYYAPSNGILCILVID